jgi:hypothetical protein
VQVTTLATIEPSGEGGEVDQVDSPTIRSLATPSHVFLALDSVLIILSQDCQVGWRLKSDDVIYGENMKKSKRKREGREKVNLKLEKNIRYAKGGKVWKFWYEEFVKN